MDHIQKDFDGGLNRLGFHYFVDVDRFKVSDAKLWSKRLNSISGTWLVVKNPINRAIPEEFIQIVRKHNIKIIVDFDADLSSYSGIGFIETLLQVYRKWGIQYARLFQTPNLRKSWGDKKWVSQDIVKLHTEYFLEFARICIENKIKPIYSTLQPGGDYWDLAFLENSLERIKENADPYIIKKLVLSAFGWHWNHKLDWGSGGKEKWVFVQPFQTLHSSQDHLGVRTFEWYEEVSQKVFGKKLPVIIFETGRSNSDDSAISPRNALSLPDTQSLITLLRGKNAFSKEKPDKVLAPIPIEVIACCFYILSADSEKKLLPYRWFEEDGTHLEKANLLMDGSKKNKKIQFPKSQVREDFETYKFQRYIFFSESLRKNVPGLLEQLDGYIKKYRPHIGFSMIEASKSAYVLIITDQQNDFLDEYESLLPDGNIVKIISPQDIGTLM